MPFNDILIFITVVLIGILFVLFIILFIKRKGDEEAKAKLKDAMREKGFVFEEKKTFISYKQVDEFFFAVGVVIFAFGFMQLNYILIGFGLIVMISSVAILAYLLKHSDEFESFSFFKNKEQRTEENIVVKANRLMKKEMELKKKEDEIKRKIEDLYNKANNIKNKEYVLNIKEKVVDKKIKAVNSTAKSPKIIRPQIIIEKDLENDVKKVLKITDNLLEMLPEAEIEKFSKSKDFELYKKVMQDLK